MELLDLNEEDMKLAEQERDAYVRAWRLEHGHEAIDPSSEETEL